LARARGNARVQAESSPDADKPSIMVRQRADERLIAGANGPATLSTWGARARLNVGPGANAPAAVIGDAVGMIHTATSPRLRLVEDKRSGSLEGPAIVRRFRLARVRLEPPTPPAPGLAPTKRS
jgi:hypothetical protein